MSMSNQNNPAVSVHDLGSPSADAAIQLMPVDRARRLRSVKVLNGAVIAASDTDYAKLELRLKSDDSVVAELDTRAAHENGLAQDVWTDLNLVAGKEDIPAGDALYLQYDETDTGAAVALTSAKLAIESYSK